MHPICTQYAPYLQWLLFTFSPAEPLKTKIYKYKFNSNQTLSFLSSSKYIAKYREKKGRVVVREKNLSL
jgi:hypothetical protein